MISHALPTRAPVRRTGERRRSTIPPSSLLELQRLAGNRAVTAALAATVQREKDDQGAGPGGAGAGGGPAQTPPKRVTGYLGLNPMAYKEAAGLTKTSPEEVRVSLNDPEAEKRFRENPAIFDFVVDELGISVGDFARWDKATDVLMNADPNLREQLADLMRWFNSAERGEIDLDRLVLSGHSNGVELWGEAPAEAESKPGTMVIERDLADLAAVFPQATGQVEDIMFSACFSINAVELVVRIFPNLRTCWTYSGASPDVAGGSTEHIVAWSNATVGEATLAKRNKRGTSALWSKEKGYIVGDPGAAAVGPLYSAVVRGARELGQPMYVGLRDFPKSTLDPYYMKIQELLAHPAAGAHRANATLARDIILRLRYWPLVRERFGNEHGGQLKPAYEAIGLAPPDWTSLTRVGLKAHYDAVKKALEAHPDAADAKATLMRLLKEGLFDLDPKIIKSGWI